MYNVVSIYSGGGGIDEGFRNAGYNVVYSTDYWEPACNTLKKNANRRLESKIIECKDIREVNYMEVLEKIGLKRGELDILAGGPPCPAYSKSRFYLKDKKRALDDESAFTLYEYFRALDELKPKVFFFENVNGFTFKPHREALELLKKESKDKGYKIYDDVLNAADYGVPQTRKRYICIGVRKDIKTEFIFPKETHIEPSKKEENDGLSPWVTAGDVLNNIDFDLPEDKNMQAGSKHKDLLKKVPPGDNYLYFTEKRGHPNPKFKWRSRYWSFLLKLSPDRPSWTIQASFSNNMGPFHWKNRFLRIQEIKRLQSFDDSYEITGEFKDKWRQIGNAVPPLLVEVIANEIKNIVLSKNI